MIMLRKSQKRLLQAALPLALVLSLVGPSCAQDQVCACQGASPVTLSLPVASPHTDLLLESWRAYRDRFIQADGRVIDREDQDRTVSEGQAYAMLRAVAINDPETFNRVFTWADNNLARRDDHGEIIDHLWAWKWGQHQDSSWGTLDANFATDADIDAATALILAYQRWGCDTYLQAARPKLADIWEAGTVALPDGQRQLIPGPVADFWPQPDQLILNPSYFAPYSFRLFAQVDPDHDWQGLIDSGYTLLNDLAAFSPTGLPPDWIAYDPASDSYHALPADQSLQSRYSFDAIRVWWRLALDAAWFQEPRASAYLQARLPILILRWQQDGRIPARLSLDGQALSTYEATSQYAMLYPALLQVDPVTAAAIYRQKLQPTYHNGFWDSDTAYYTQNLVWFGLLPTDLSPQALQTARENCSPQ